MEKFLPDLKEESMEDCDGNCGEEDDAFYEEIEAPKFVDFTVSDDRSRLDDPSWFCVRVGELFFLFSSSQMIRKKEKKKL